jgi:hypothetical protein
MRNFLLGVSLLGLVGAGAGVTWSVLSRPEDAYITHEVADSFNLKNGPAPLKPMVAPGETFRDAVAAAPPAASSLTAPIATEGMAYGKMKALEPQATSSKPYTTISAKAQSWLRKRVGEMASRPAAYMLNRSSLGSAKSLRQFLASPGKVDAYMNSAAVRVALNSPAAAKLILGNPAVVRAFLNTPAMKDPQAVRELLKSPMLAKMLDCPGIQGALNDQTVVNRMISDPQTVMWAVAHPQALTAIAQAAPALGEALSARGR